MSDTQQKLAIRTSSKPLATQFDIMFDRDIDHANEWHEELYVMRQAVEGDLCNIHINTCGGAVSTISAFQSIKEKSEAHFHGILEGMGYSAGSAFFLMCDTHEVGDFAEMMIHTSQGSGFYSHSQGREDYGKQAARTARKLVETVYKDFLTPEEIEELLIGKEFWLDSDEIRERLEKRETIRNQQAIEEAKETYTPEVYASSCAQDILEDCEQFGYCPKEIVEGILKAVTAENGMTDVVQQEEDEDPEVEMERVYITSDGQEVNIDGEITDILSCDLPRLRYIGRMCDLKFAHNIGTEKLRQRILDFLNEED